MYWLQRLLTLDIPKNATLQGAELSLRGLFPWWAAALLVMVAGAGVILLYWREQARIGVVRRLLLAGVRIAALALIVALLLRPVLVAEYRGQRPRGIALLVDNSQSMGLRDRRLSTPDRLRVAIAQNLVAPDTPISSVNIPTGTPADPRRADLVIAALANPRLNLVNELESKGSVRAYLFGQRVRTLDATDRDTKQDPATKNPPIGSRMKAALNADDSRTALADAIRDLLVHRDGDLPAAIVVMTDGRDNASKASLDDVAVNCQRLGVPLHIYGVGSADGGLLNIQDVSVSATLFYDDIVSVPIRWHLQGFSKPQVQLSLRLGNDTVVRRDATPKEIEQQRAVLTFVPHKSEAAQEETNLVGSVLLKSDSAFHDEMTRPIRLMDRRVRVLYIESSPRWEYKFLQASLLRDRRVEPSFLLVNADPGVRNSGRPFLPAFPGRDQLFTYDLLILGDVPATYLGTEHMEWIRDFVKEGGGLVTIAGRQHAPASFADSPLAEVLPVEILATTFASGSNRPELFVPVLTDAGKRSDMMALADEQGQNLRTWNELSGFSWYYPAVKLRAGAIALLNHPHDRLKIGNAPMPVLAAQYYGRGESLFLASDETWRWRFNAGDRYFARFWGQVIYRLGLPHLLGSSRRAQLELEHSDMMLGRPASVYARLFDREFRPWQAERVPARLESLDPKAGSAVSRKVMLEAVPGEPGEYRALLANDVPGRFELRVDSPEAATLPYRVTLPPGHELESVGIAIDDLREAARLSNGHFYREEDLHSLPGQVTAAQATFTVRQDILLWNPLVLAIFVGLVTIEWTVRKFSNLS